MFGQNKILKPKKGDGNKLEVQEIFATFQGEGIYTGWPAVFIRLGGCNLACKFCDTEFDSFKELDLVDILLKIEGLSFNKNSNRRNIDLVVISGGEPLRQPISRLCRELIKRGFLVQIESNGTLFQKLPKKVKIICSPKNVSGKYHLIRPDLLPQISAFKFLISAFDKKYSDVPEIGQAQFNTPIYVQPMDEYDERKNAANRKLTLKIAQKNGYRLSLQTHKIWGIE